MSAADSFDNVLSALGFGRWQIPSLLVTILALSQFSVHLIGSPLLSAPLPFRCSMTQPNLSNSSWTEDASSLDFDEECLSFPTISTTSTFTNTTSTSTSTTSTSTNLTIANTSNITSQLLTSSDAASSTIRIITTTSASADIIDTSSVGPSSTPVNLTTIWHTTGLPSCPIVQYDTSVFTSTVISEWDLVCERTVLRPLFQTLFTVGGMLGSTIGGHLGDRFGRRRAVLAACVVNLLVVVSMTLATFFPLLITLRFLTGCSVMAMVVPAWSLTLESTPAGYRTRVGMLLGLPFSASTVCFAGVGYTIRAWRILLLVCSSPILILLPVAFMTDESPRWLVQQERMEEATQVLQKAFRRNQVQLNTPLASLLDRMVQQERKTSSACGRAFPGSCALPGRIEQVWAYLRAPAMRTIIVVTPTLWFLHSCLYLGVVINANNFTSRDPFLYLALTGLMEALAIVIITPLTAHMGRRIMVWAGLGMGGILLMLELLVPNDSVYYWLDWVLVMVGFLLVAGAFQVNYVYAPELFPTEARARGFAFVSVMGSIGFSCAPLITHILEEYAWWAVSVTFGCAGILGSLMVPFLPETNKRPLPETLQDVENRHKWRRGARNTLEDDGVCHTNMTPLLETAPSGSNTPESPLSHQHISLHHQHISPHHHHSPHHQQYIPAGHICEADNPPTNNASSSSVL